MRLQLEPPSSIFRLKNVVAAGCIFSAGTSIRPIAAYSPASCQDSASIFKLVDPRLFFVESDLG
jgi:hypothetical protein